MQYKISFFLIFFGILTYSCYDENFKVSTSGDIDIAFDTILFDTVFTQIGTVTQHFTVHNNNSNSIEISSIELGGGEQSPYRVNVNGIPGTSFQDIIIRSNDSIYIFVDATIDPLNSNLPMVVNDSLIFTTNGNTNKVKLVAFGQDVHLFNAKVLKTQTWNSNKPYLIYNNAALDTGEVLTITEGTKIFMHANSSLLIYGTLNIKGTYENPVVITGDRLDRGYPVSAGQWGTIYLDPDSKNNTVDYAVIKNAVAGFQIGYPGDWERKVDLTISNSIIQNSSYAGIYAFYADILAYNTIVTDCGSTALLITQGGKYRFYHCTISNINSYYNYFDKEITYYGSHSLPSVIVSNYYKYAVFDRHLNPVDSTFYYDLEECSFVNSIITGKQKEELALIDTNIREFNYFLENSILTYTETDDEDTIDVEDSDHFVNLILNPDSIFVNPDRSVGEYDFTPDSLSPARDSGSVDIINQYDFLQTDFKGKNRMQDGKPDIGAIERYDL